MNPNIFREFSIRGIADQDLTDDVVVIIGRAIAAFFKQQNVASLMLGRDVRNSASRISLALTKGLLQMGMRVTDIGVAPTPVHNFATDFYQAEAGIMITASHNPPEYNGLKIRRHDRTLHGDELQEIYHIALAEQSRLTSGQDISVDEQIEQIDPLPLYLENVKKQAQIGSFLSEQSFKVVVDGGNGTNGRLVSQLLQDLGIEVVELYCEPDGSFPGRGSDPTKPEAVADLSALVKKKGADLGLAYDGDGDRLVLIDDQGNQVLGDQIMMLLARDVLRAGPAKIVYEILCTQALADDIIAHGGEPIMTPSGYAFAHETMHSGGAAIAGELSGHLFFNEPNFHFDDSILATIKLLNVIAQNRRALSALVGELPAYCSSPQVRIPCPDSLKAQIVETVRLQFEDKYEVDTLDGARIHFPDGWATVRQSNTQPVISMRFEARAPEQLKAIQETVQSFVEAEIKRRVNG